MKAILAADDNLGIGKDGGIPWDSKNDLRFFRLMTIGESIVMGRKTFNSIGGHLKDRKSYVLTRDHRLKHFMTSNPIFDGWIIGGSIVFHDAIKQGVIDMIFLSRIKGDYGCDTFINIPSNFRLLCTFKLDGLTVEKYKRKR